MVINQAPNQTLTSKILIVDDVPDNLRLLSTTLTQQGYQVRCAKNGSMALMGAKSDLPNLILLDIRTLAKVFYGMLKGYFYLDFLQFK